MTSPRLHVLHVIKGLGRGGAETLLAHAQRHVDREAFRLSFVYFHERKSALVEELRALGADVTLIRGNGPVSMFWSVSRLARHLNDTGVDLLHAHLPLSAVVARLAARRAGVPAIYTEHNLQERHHPATRSANRLTWRLQRRVIAVSEAVKVSIERYQGTSVPVDVVPNGVPIERLRPDPAAARRFRDSQQIPAHAPLVGQIAVFRPEKRLELWLEAAALVRTEHPECHFVLIGAGPEGAALERRSRALGLDGSVHFTGLLDDVAPALSAIDVHLISSRFEGLPLVLLESMAMATPVVATRVGGIPEAIVDGETGTLVSAEAPAEELASAVSRLLADRERGVGMGRAAAASVAGRFSSVAMQRRLEEIYREVLA